MNKRIKKKRELENSLRIAGSAIDFLLDQNNQLWQIVERNAEATNKELDSLRKEIAKLKAKKPWWKR